MRPAPEEARGWIGQPLYGTFAQRHPKRAAELVESYIAWNIEHLSELLQEYPGVAELLAELSASGAMIGVVTSKWHSAAASTLEAAGLALLLPVLVAMEDTAVHKPYPEPLLLALERLGVGADQCVYIGTRSSTSRPPGPPARLPLPSPGGRGSAQPCTPPARSPLWRPWTNSAPSSWTSWLNTTLA